MSRTNIPLQKINKNLYILNVRTSPETPVIRSSFSKVEEAEWPELESNNSSPSKGTRSCTSTTLQGFVKFTGINLFSPSIFVSSQFLTGSVTFRYTARHATDSPTALWSVNLSEVIPNTNPKPLTTFPTSLR